MSSHESECYTNYYDKLIEPLTQNLQIYLKSKFLYWYAANIHRAHFDSFDVDMTYWEQDLFSAGCNRKNIESLCRIWDTTEKFSNEIKNKKFNFENSKWKRFISNMPLFNLFRTKSLKELDFGGIYFLYQGENDRDGLTKIGMSNTNIGNRILSMKTALPHKNTKGFCIRYKPYSLERNGISINDMEKVLHEHFKNRRSHNEWFNLSYNELEIILFVEIIKKCRVDYYIFDINYEETTIDPKSMFDVIDTEKLNKLVSKLEEKDF